MNCQLYQLGSRQLELRYISFLWFPHIILSQFYSLIILAQNVQKPFQSFSNTVFINLFHSIASFIRIRVFSQIVFGYSCLQSSSSLHLWVLRHCTVRLDDGNGWRDLPVICKTVMNIMSNCHINKASCWFIIMERNCFIKEYFLKQSGTKLELEKPQIYLTTTNLLVGYQNSENGDYPTMQTGLALFFTTIRMNGINDDLYDGRFLKSFMTRKIKKCLEFF